MWGWARSFAGQHDIGQWGWRDYGRGMERGEELLRSRSRRLFQQSFELGTQIVGRVVKADRLLAPGQPCIESSDEEGQVCKRHCDPDDGENSKHCRTSTIRSD